MSDMNLKHRLVYTFRNGSGSVHSFDNTIEAYHYARNNTSYRSVSRIELILPGGYLRALWDENWMPESQILGLELPA